MIASNSCCRFVGSTSMMWISYCSIGLRYTWTHGHVQETNLRWSEICEMACYSAGSSHQKYTVVMDMVSINTPVVQENIPHTITSPAAAWSKDLWQDRSIPSCCFHQILTLPPFRGSKFCCCSSSTLRFYVLCPHRCSSAYRVAIWVIWFEAVCKCSIDVRLETLKKAEPCYTQSYLNNICFLF